MCPWRPGWPNKKPLLISGAHKLFRSQSSWVKVPRRHHENILPRTHLAPGRAWIFHGLGLRSSSNIQGGRQPGYTGCGPEKLAMWGTGGTEPLNGLPSPHRRPTHPSPRRPALRPTVRAVVRPVVRPTFRLAICLAICPRPTSRPPPPSGPCPSPRSFAHASS